MPPVKPTVAATPEQVRETLRSLATEYRVTLAALSRMLRQPPGYLSRFSRGGGPERLRATEGKLLAKYFRVSPRLFGERENWEPHAVGSEAAPTAATRGGTETA